MSTPRRVRPACALCLAILSSVPFAACRNQAMQSEQSQPIRLVDHFKSDAILGRAKELTTRLEPCIWRFDGNSPSQPAGGQAETRGWRAGHQVEEFRITDGRLVGVSSGEYPLIGVERTAQPDDHDLLHSVEIRMLASAGRNCTVAFRDDESDELDFKKVAEEMQAFPSRPMSSPLMPGKDMHTYTISIPFPVKASALKQFILRPTDAAGTTFEIESLRLIFRREHLAAIPSGIGWHGLDGIFRESIASRPSEVVQFQMTLSSRPWLDMAVGTIDPQPATFTVEVVAETGAAKQPEIRIERTVTRPHVWQRVPVELSALAGKSVTVKLSLSADRPDVLGFWGSPVIRQRIADPNQPPPVGSPPQGIILIWADTLRMDHLDVYGYERPTAPVLKRMAAEGAIFNDCLSQATWTKVSTPSLFTGLYPSSHTVQEFSDRLPAAATTLAEAFRQAGSATLSLSSILFTGKFTNLHQGFEEVHESDSLPKELDSKTARECVDRLLPWLEAHRDVPFFVFLHVSDPHDPFQPLSPYDALWADPAHRQEHRDHAEKVKEFIADPLMKRFGMPNRAELAAAGIDPDEYVRREIADYDGSIRGMDAEIGRLLERLAELKLDRRTIIAFASDHGEEFLEHGRMFHGQTVYGELNRVPLILWGPGRIPAGRIIDQTVEIVDVMPTLLEMCGLPSPPEVQGASLMALLDDPSATADLPSRPAFTEKAATAGDMPGPPPHNTESLSIVVDGWKLIRNSGDTEGLPEFELYNHQDDPLNRHDVATSHPDIVRQLAERLEAWRKATLENRLPSDDEATADLEAEELERLRSLGYVN